VKKMLIGSKRIVVKREILAPILMLAFSILYFFDSYKLSFSALVFPRICLIVLCITSIFTIKDCIIILNGKVCEESFEEHIEGWITKEELEPLASKKTISFFICLIIFILSLPYTGIFLGIPLFLIVSMLLLGVKNYKTLIIAPITVLLVIYIVFVYILKIPLPAGYL